MEKVDNNVIIVRLDGLKEIMNEKFDENNKNHETMLAQVTYTNGRVRGLEKWKWGLAGGIAVLSFLGVGTMLSYLRGVDIDTAQEKIEIQKMVQSAVENTLKNYQPVITNNETTTR
jgi:hypothetical protein